MKSHMKTFTSIFDLGKILDLRKRTSTAWYLEVRKIGGQAVLNKAYVINTLPFVTFKCIIFIYTTVIGLYVLDLGLKLDLLYNRMPNIICLPLRDPTYVTVQIPPFEKLTAIYM